MFELSWKDHLEKCGHNPKRNGIEGPDRSDGLGFWASWRGRERQYAPDVGALQGSFLAREGQECRRFPQFFGAISEEAQGSSYRSEISTTVSSEGLSPVEDVKRAEGRVKRQR